MQPGVQMLGGVRVLDVTGPEGHLTGMLLAQLGAEVVAAEPAGGVASRRTLPLIDGVGAAHEAFNRGKRSVVLDDDGLRTLAAAADVVLWSGSPADCPFDPAHRAAHSVLVTVTPFGWIGPKADWPATDLTLSAAAGISHLTGDPDRPPLRVSVPQAWHHGALDATVGTLLALAERERSGLGQHVSVSAQRSYLQAAFAAPLLLPWQRETVNRAGHGLRTSLVQLRFGYPSADGEVSITHIYGPTFAPHVDRLFAWIHAEGGCSDEIGAIRWGEVQAKVMAGELSPALLEQARTSMAEWTRRRTGAELDAMARQRKVLVQSVKPLREVARIEHLTARDAWDHHHSGVRLPGPIARLSATPLPHLDPAPTLGADPLPAWQPRAATAAETRTAPLDGLVVLDLSWSYAGPLLSQALAQAGATVLKIESSSRIDNTRTGGIRTRDEVPDHSTYFHTVNSMKRSVLLDITRPEGAAVLGDLVERADVLVESFSAGVMDRLGLGYRSLSARNPGLVMVSSSLTGQTGPLASYPGYGNLASALFGFSAVTAWPDRPVAAPYLAYTDVVSFRFGQVALLGALAHRRATGEGQHIDLAQGECSLHLLADALLASQAGIELPLGNDDIAMSPHAVYRCAGDDRWVAVAVTDDAMWDRLTVLVDAPSMAGLGLADRRAHRAAIDDAIAAWTTTRTPADAEAALIDAGVAAHRVADAADMISDPQLADHWCTVDRFGDIDVVVEGPRITLSDTPLVVDRRGPMLGEHTFEVLTERCGYSAERIAELAALGVLE